MMLIVLLTSKGLVRGPTAPDGRPRVFRLIGSESPEVFDSWSKTLSIVTPLTVGPFPAGSLHRRTL